MRAHPEASWDGFGATCIAGSRHVAGFPVKRTRRQARTAVIWGLCSLHVLAGLQHCNQTKLLSRVACHTLCLQAVSELFPCPL